MVKENEMKISVLMKDLERICKAKGLRMTHQRSEIFYELAKYPGHLSAENVFSRVRKRLRTISLDTVYRTIATFEEHGLIKRIQILDNSARFDVNLSVHHHLVCTGCNKIEDFCWPKFDRMKLPGSIVDWTNIDSRQIEVHGICRDCRLKLKK